MGKGNWRMGKGNWRMGEGNWRMGKGNWRMGKGCSARVTCLELGCLVAADMS